MTSSRPTGQDPQSKLLWDILRQLDRLSGIVANPSFNSAVTIANGADVTEGHTTDAYSLATDSTAVTVISVLKAVSYLLQNTLKVGIADGADVTLGAKADAKSAATDTTAVSIMSVLKEVSYLLQNAIAVTVANGGIVALGSTTDAKSAVTDGTAATLISLTKEVSYLLQSVESAANTARTTATIVVSVQQIGPSGYPVDVNSAGELKVFNPPSTMLAEYRSPTDFAVVYTSNVTLTVTGASFTVDDTVCRVTSIMYKKVDGLFYGLYNGRGGVSIACVSGVITVSGAGTPFTNTDILYDVNIVAAKKAYDPTTDTNKITNQNPDSLQYVLDSIVNTTNVATGTYYPSSTGLSMDGYKDLSMTGELIDGAGHTTTLTLEATNDPTATLWTTLLYGYDTKNNIMVNSISATNATVLFAVDFDAMNYSFVRWLITTSDPSNTVIIYSRRKAL